MTHGTVARKSRDSTSIFSCRGLRGSHGLIWNCLLLVSTPLGVVTLTKPVVAPLGTAVRIAEFALMVNAAAIPLKLTSVAPGQIGSMPIPVFTACELREIACDRRWQ
jgi:hypothetical protein